MQRQPVKPSPAVQGGLYPTLLRLSSEAAAVNPCRKWVIFGVSWCIRCLTDRRSGGNFITSKIAQEWRRVGCAVGLVPSILACIGVRSPDASSDLPAVEKGVRPKHHSWLRGSGTSPAQGPSCLPPPPPLSTPQLLPSPRCSGKTEQTERPGRC